MKNVLDMLLKDTATVDVGSIERTAPAELSLLAADKTKLNSVVTKEVLTPLLADGQTFNIPSGCHAVVLDAPAVWRYHAGTDLWYEIIPPED